MPRPHEHRLKYSDHLPALPMLSRHLIAALLLTSPIGLTLPALAQTTPIVQPAPIQQGRKIRFNGQSEPVGWSQWQMPQGPRLFISEIALTQLLGVQLLNSTDPKIQPIAWFSGINRSIAQLPVQFVGTERHFDITDFAALSGWEIRLSSGQISITTPSAKVQGIQISQQPWGDRLEIALDGPIAYQTNALKDEFSLTLNAQTETTIGKAINQQWQYPPLIVPSPIPAPTTPTLPGLAPIRPKLLPTPIVKQQILPTPAPTPTPTPTPAVTPGEDPRDNVIPAPTIPVNKFKRLQTFKLETTAQSTILKLGLSLALRPQIRTEFNPTRLIIDIGNPAVPDRDIQWTNGLQWRQRLINGFPINWLELDPKQPGLQIQPILPNQTSLNLPAIAQPTLTGVATVSQTARGVGAIGAINGGYFNRNNQFPLGAIRINQIWRSGPILDRGIIAWNPNGDWQFDRLTNQAAVLKDGTRIELKAFNSAYLQAGIAHYNKDWGLTYTSMTDGEVIATIRNGQVFAQTIAENPGTIVPITTQDELLVFRSNRTGAAQFPIGTPVQIDRTIAPTLNRFDPNNYQNIIGGGPLLLLNGQSVLNTANENFTPAFLKGRAARSAIAQTSNGQILFVAAQNSPDSNGPTFAEFTQILQQIGAMSALNLDGGSSTTLYLGGQIVDRSPRSSASVHNAIGIFITPKL
jgi:exopolysaccharide biosynthesis protein